MTADALGTVMSIVEQYWGVKLRQSDLPRAARFLEDGWSYKEAIGKPCPDCSGMMHSIRKPYVTQGRTQHYVVLICPSCPRTFQMRDVGARSYRDLMRTPVQHQGTNSSARTAPAPSDIQAPHMSRVATPVSAEAARRASVVRFWRSVELFSAQRVEPECEERFRYNISPGQPMPWEEGHGLRTIPLARSHRWKFTVYGGLYALEQLYRTLDQVFPDNEFDVDERTPRGTSALFSVDVTEDGQLVLDSMTLSTAAWAVGRTVDPGPADPAWLDGFERAETDHRELVEHLAGRVEDDGEIALSKPVQAGFFFDLVKKTAHRLGVAGALAPGGLRVACHKVHRSAKTDIGTGFLNSFVAHDLERVAGALAHDDCGHALRDYLSATESQRRFDVQAPENRAGVAAMLAPDRIPAGRWPANPRHTAATSQQLAINELTQAGDSSHRTFGVNGPPGTGKTTMLRDLVAALVTERARRLSGLARPADAFGAPTGWAIGRTDVRFRPLRPEFTGFEMLVASANNAAVENVTREMPAADAIDEPFTDADYLAEFASRVLGAPGWGLIAAPLGNQANRNEFVNRLWFSQNDPKKEPRTGLSDWLTAQEGTIEWPTAVHGFRDALVREERIRAGRVAAWQALQSIPALNAAVDRTCTQLQSARKEADDIRQQAHTSVRYATQAAQALQQAIARREQHQQRRPKFWETVLTLGRLLREWADEDRALREEVHRTDFQARNSAYIAGQWQAHEARAQALLNEHAAAYERACVDQARACSVVQAVTDSGVRIPNDRWYQDEAFRETAAPWLDPEWDEARSRVFLAALELHRAFLTCAGAPLRGLLRASIDAVKGKVPADAPPTAVAAAWQGLFLAVPVVSTTFASVDRMLGRLGSESLGWLLIDEAGQATPQDAVGAIWRAQRVVAVGDPLQLEPVVTILHSTQARLRDHHGVDNTWLPSRESVQTLVDRVATIGTTQRGADCDTWVGAPLRVHRRCQDPMFSIVNSAVYNGLMIHALPPASASTAADDCAALPPSAWFDVPSRQGRSHWIPEEGRAAKQLLYELSSTYGLDPAEDILVVTPFGAAASGMTGLVRNMGLSSIPVTGTVHRSQGKQARVVIFVLGGNPTRLGARDWAAARPNLLNVAVSRAKERLYVIGHHADWSRRRPYFSTLAHALPLRSIDEGGLLAEFGNRSGL